MTAWVAGQFPRGEDESPAAHARAVRAKALDLVRGILPPRRSRTWASTRAARRTSSSCCTCWRTRSPRRRHTGRCCSRSCSRSSRASSSACLARIAAAAGSSSSRSGARPPPARPSGSASTRRSDGRRAVGAARARARHRGGAARRASLRGRGGRRGGGASARSMRSPTAERAALIRELVGERENRRHRPGRGFETLSYRFEIVSDYGAFRDLQRHRLLTCQWQRLSPDLGADVPHELVRPASAASTSAHSRSRAPSTSGCAAKGSSRRRRTRSALAFRIRYVLELDAREALHLIELRSGHEGHPSYRAVAHEMRRAIAEVHPNVAAAMTLRRRLDGGAARAAAQRDAERSARVVDCLARRRTSRSQASTPTARSSTVIASSAAASGARISTASARRTAPSRRATSRTRS